MSHDSHIWVELQCHYKNCNSHQWRTNSIRCIQGKAISHWCHSRQRRMALYTKGNKLTVVRCSTAAYQLFPARIKLLVDQSVVMDDPIQNENANGNQESMIEEYSSHNTNRIQTDQTNDLDDTQDASDHDDTNHNNQNRAARARTQITDNQLNDSQEQTNRIQSDPRARTIDSIMDMNIDVEHGVADELDQKGSYVCLFPLTIRNCKFVQCEHIVEPLTDRQLRQTSSFTMQRTTNGYFLILLFILCIEFVWISNFVVLFFFASFSHIDDIMFFYFKPHDSCVNLIFLIPILYISNLMMPLSQTSYADVLIIYFESSCIWS
eukprot:949491_1